MKTTDELPPGSSNGRDMMPGQLARRYAYAIGQAALGLADLAAEGHLGSGRGGLGSRACGPQLEQATWADLRLAHATLGELLTQAPAQ